MSKELNKVNEIHHTRAIYKADGTTVIESSLFNLLVAYAKEALQRLEAIDNANPSEALVCVDKILGYFGKAQIETMTLSKCNVLTIKQALLKAQEQEKVIRLIFEKKVNILLLELAENVNEYNERIIPNGKLTEEEFNILKEVEE